MVARVIFSVTASRQFCSIAIASDNGFPRRLTPLIARIRSFTWMAPVLDEKKLISQLFLDKIAAQIYRDI